MAYASGYSLKEEFGRAADDLVKGLMELRPLKKGDRGEKDSLEAAQALSEEALKQAFNFYRGKVSLTDEEMKMMLPELRGALKIVDALVEKGARFPLEIMPQMVANASRAVRSRKSKVAR